MTAIAARPELVFHWSHRMSMYQTRCDATGSISIDGRTVASRTGPVTLPVSIPLGHGILLNS
jgi:hypothetical protein